MTANQIVALVQGHPGPVLFFDTCSLLDIVRAAGRDGAGDVRAARDLRGHASAAPPAVHLIVQDIVPSEWNDNLASARNAGEAGLRAFASTWEIASTFGHPVPPLPTTPLPTLIDDLEQLSRDLLALSTVMDRDVVGLSWALDRVVAKRKPTAGKGGAVKDCAIVGHALVLSDGLRLAGHTRTRIFVSSNTGDFQEQGGGVHHQLAPEFQASGLVYDTSIAKALTRLRAAGELP